MAINANLQSSQPLATDDQIVPPATYDPDLADQRDDRRCRPGYSISPPNGTASPTSSKSPSPCPISKGGQQTLTMSLLKTGANTWNYEIWSPNIADAAGNTIATGGLGQVATGTLAFTASGGSTLSNSTSNDLTTTPPARPVQLQPRPDHRRVRLGRGHVTALGLEFARRCRPDRGS